MNISKKPLLIGLIVISSLVTLISYGNSNSTKHEEKHEKIFSEIQQRLFD